MIEQSNIIAQVPQSFYVIVGGILLANIGTVVTIFYGIGRVVWFLAKMDSRVESVEKDTNAAHQSIREVKAMLSKP